MVYGVCLEPEIIAVECVPYSACTYLLLHSYKCHTKQNARATCMETCIVTPQAIDRKRLSVTFRTPGVCLSLILLNGYCKKMQFFHIFSYFVLFCSIGLFAQMIGVR